MVRVFYSVTLFDVNLVKGLLEERGIRCIIRNDVLASTLGVTRMDMHPEVLVEAEDAVRARQIIDEYLSRVKASGAAAWTCESCGEEVDAELGQCWSCLSDKPTTL
jgi:hypothetical protein